MEWAQFKTVFISVGISKLVFFGPLCIHLHTDSFFHHDYLDLYGFKGNRVHLIKSKKRIQDGGWFLVLL